MPDGTGSSLRKGRKMTELIIVLTLFGYAVFTLNVAIVCITWEKVEGVRDQKKKKIEETEAAGSQENLEEFIKALDEKFDSGSHEGVIECPKCGGNLRYHYDNFMAMRAKCDSCDFYMFS